MKCKDIGIWIKIQFHKNKEIKLSVDNLTIQTMKRSIEKEWILFKDLKTSKMIIQIPRGIERES